MKNLKYENTHIFLLGETKMNTQENPQPKKESPQIESSKVFYINSWGSCSRSYLEILYPKKVSYNQLLTLSNKTRTLEDEIAKYEIQYYDSRKNLHREIRIYPKTPLLVHKWGQGSCNPNSAFNEVWLLVPNGEPQQLEFKDEVREREDDKYAIKEIVRYVEYDGKKFEVSTEVLEKQVIETKLEVIITAKKDKVIVGGDTYNIRDLLKSLKFRWNGAQKIWERQGSDYDDVQLKLEEKGIKVTIKDEVGEQ